MTETEPSNLFRGRGDAESIALRVFEFITADVDRIIQFMNITGLQPETIRESAKSAHFLLGVLDYASKDEGLLKKIEEEIGIRPAAILVAAVHLAPQPEGQPNETRSNERAPELPRRNLFQ
ncbi:DUF3572 family protein [Microvirga zambiensis]|uniref:DUF3572 family protein n=1 Tax=Microvirga zambiensis TaxID=1402137 RepID=UPI00191E31E2|nr:DUF3572 family protein [Microvirga zambiensis]